MFKNYLKLAVRRIRKDTFFSILNITGLTVGVTAFILLTLYVRYELSYDQFHSNGDRIYVLASGGYYDRNGPVKGEHYRLSYAKRMKEKIPEMQNMAMIGGISGEEILIEVEDESFYEQGIMWGSSEVFEIFDFPILSGTVQLEEADKAVITEHLARKYFGNENPIGKTFNIEEQGTFEITAVAKDIPVNSHIQFNLLVSGINELKDAELEFANNGGSLSINYILFPEDTDLEALNDKIWNLKVSDWPDFAKPKEVNGEKNQFESFVPYTDIHLRSGFTNTPLVVGDIRYVYLFGSIAILILVIACLNYVNLVTAKSVKRMKEIGIRKVMGASKGTIMRQTISESFLVAFLSVILAFAISERILPFFNNLIERELTLTYFSLEFLVFVIALSGIVGLVSGIYPALRLSRFTPAKALSNNKGKEGAGVRRGLVFFQFLIAQALIVATVIIQSQLSYLQNKDLGYDREHALYIQTHSELGDQTNVFKTEIESIPGVKEVSLSNGTIELNGTTFMWMRDIEGSTASFADDFMVADIFDIDEKYLDVMGMELTMGSGFNDTGDFSPKNAMIINEACMKKLGWDEPLGKKVNDVWGGDKYIIGVIKDFHNESLKAEIKPAMMVYSENPVGFVNIKVSPNNIKQTLETIEGKWGQFVEDRPFQFQFYDDKYDTQYRSEVRLGTIFNAFSTMAICISILGLIGLTAFSVEQRLKEFGIRKVLGAKVNQLVGLLSREFIVLIVLSFAVAGPIAYFGLERWLDGFVYQVNINALVFILAIGITIVISVLAVTNQAYKVSKVNPADILRTE